MKVPSLRTLDLNLLKVFDVVMSERSLTRASHQLALTQPAVSNALRRLRDTLGDELLVRQGRFLAPTPRALALWPAVRAALQQLQDVLTPSAFSPQSAGTTYVLTMADATAAELMPGLLERITRLAPGVSLRVVPLTTRDPRRLLEEGHADLAIGHFPAVLADSTARAQAGEPVSYRHHRLFSGDYVCAMRRNHPMAGAPLTLERFCEARHMLVSFSGRPFGFVDEALSSLGRSRKVVLTVNQFFTAGKVVAHSDVLTVLPRHFVSAIGLSDELVLRELPFAVAPIRVDTLWHLRQDGSSAHQWLRNQIHALALAQFGPSHA